MSLINPMTPDASTTLKGKVELATQGEFASGVAVQGNDERLGTFSGVNADSGTIFDGMVIAAHASGIMRADADDLTRCAVGLARIGAVIAGTVTGQTSGLLSLSDWSAVTGTTTLTPQAVYYVSATAGMLTTTAPTGSGKGVQVVGKALTTTIIAILVADRYKLGD